MRADSLTARFAEVSRDVNTPNAINFTYCDNFALVCAADQRCFCRFSDLLLILYLVAPDKRQLLFQHVPLVTFLMDCSKHTYMHEQSESNIPDRKG